MFKAENVSKWAAYAKCSHEEGKQGGGLQHDCQRKRGVLCVCVRWWRNDGLEMVLKSQENEISAFPHPMGKEV